jgi:phosphatidylserine/phosphatidylglycerophosphate/cardiolipin synthase-like enzyme
MQLTKNLIFIAALSFGMAAPTLASAYEVCLPSSANCDSLIAAVIKSARHQVLFRDAGATSTQIAAALVEARHRGVEVRAIVEAANNAGRYPVAASLAKNGIPTLLDKRAVVGQARVVIIDGTDVVTGSFNFTRASEQRSADGVLVMHGDRSLAAAYADLWHTRERESLPYAVWMRARATHPSLSQADRLGDQ